MTKAPGTVYDVQVSTGGKLPPARDAAAPSYSAFSDALAAIRERYLADGPARQVLGGGNQIDILVGSGGGRVVRTKRAPRYEFFIDPLATDEASSTGAPTAPWPTLSKALAGL